MHGIHHNTVGKNVILDARNSQKQVIVVVWLHQYMEFVAQVLMYSRGCVQGNILTRGLQVPCTNV